MGVGMWVSKAGVGREGRERRAAQTEGGRGSEKREGRVGREGDRERRAAERESGEGNYTVGTGTETEGESEAYKSSIYYARPVRPSVRPCVCHAFRANLGHAFNVGHAFQGVHQCWDVGVWVSKARVAREERERRGRGEGDGGRVRERERERGKEFETGRDAGEREERERRRILRLSSHALLACLIVQGGREGERERERERARGEERGSEKREGGRGREIQSFAGMSDLSGTVCPCVCRCVSRERETRGSEREVFLTVCSHAFRGRIFTSFTHKLCSHA